MSFKKGVSTWSYLNMFMCEEITPEGMLEEISKTGATGVEILPAMNRYFAYPDYTQDDVAKWKDLMQKYNLEPVSNSSMIICVSDDNPPTYMPPGMSAHHNPTLAEMTELMKKEIDLTYDFGFKILRHPMMNGMSLDAIEAALPYAEDKGVALDLEIHTPLQLDGPEVTKQIEMIEKNNAKYAGLIPDLNAFQDHLPKSLRDMVLARGADEDDLALVDKALLAHEDMTDLMEEMKAKGNDATIQYASTAAALAPNNLEDLRPFAKYINHVHMKFFDVNDEGVETTFDVGAYMNFFKEIGYDGWLISEYEGGMYHMTFGTEAVEQVRRHIDLMNRLDK